MWKHLYSLQNAGINPKVRKSPFFIKFYENEITSSWGQIRCFAFIKEAYLWWLDKIAWKSYRKSI